MAIDNLPLFANSGRSWIRRGLQFRDERQRVDGVARHVPSPDAHLPDAPTVAEVQQVLARKVVQVHIRCAMRDLTRNRSLQIVGESCVISDQASALEDNHLVSTDNIVHCLAKII